MAHRPDPKFEIRALAPEEWGVVRGLRLQALLDAPEAFTSNHGRESAYDDAEWRRFATACQWFVATDDGEVVAMAGGYPADSDAQVREVIGMWVAPAHRRKGTARSLLDHIAEWARAQGAARLRLGVDARNAGARETYLRCGLRLTGETEPVVGDPTRSIEVMDRDLASG
jgi:GNAT superfamily N-acetyltransferase